MHGYGSLSRLEQPHPGYWEELAARVLREVQGWSDGGLGQFCAEMDSRLLVEDGTTLGLIRHLLAGKTLVCSMEEPIEVSTPLRRFHVAEKGRKRITG